MSPETNSYEALTDKNDTSLSHRSRSGHSLQLKCSKRLLQSSPDSASPDSSPKYCEKPCLREYMTTLRTSVFEPRQRPPALRAGRIVGARLRGIVQCTKSGSLPVLPCSR